MAEGIEDVIREGVRLDDAVPVAFRPGLTSAAPQLLGLDAEDAAGGGGVGDGGSRDRLMEGGSEVRGNIRVGVKSAAAAERGAKGLVGHPTIPRLTHHSL